MMCWHEIETAPTDGRVVIGDYDGFPVMMAYVEEQPQYKWERRGRWPFYKWERVQRDPESGWRVLLLNRDFGYSVHGNYGPFRPAHWMPIPAFPEP